MYMYVYLISIRFQSTAIVFNTDIDYLLTLFLHKGSNFTQFIYRLILILLERLYYQKCFFNKPYQYSLKRVSPRCQMHVRMDTI